MAIYEAREPQKRAFTFYKHYGESPVSSREFVRALSEPGKLGETARGSSGSASELRDIGDLWHPGGTPDALETSGEWAIYPELSGDI